jgi:hypothetical protein
MASKKQKQLRARRQRRIKTRTATNQAAREAAAELEAESRPRRVYAMTQLEILLNAGRRGRGGITAEQYESGDRLFKDWYISDSEQRLVPSYMREIGCGGSGGFSELQIVARWRYEHAMKAVGIINSAVVMHVCIRDLPLSHWNRQMVYPDGTPFALPGVDIVVKSPLAMLRDGLDRITAWREGVSQKDVDNATHEVLRLG